GEEDHRQWRHHQHQGIGPAVVRHRGGLYRSQVPVAASPVGSGIAVEHFAPHPPAWCSYPIVRTRYWREVADHQQRRVGSLPLAQEAHYTALSIIALDPGKAPWLTIPLVQHRSLAIELVQVHDPLLEPGMRSALEQMPVEARLVVPLSPLAKLPAHEEEFFAGLGIHIAQQEAEGGVLLP